MNNKENLKKTLIVALLLSLVCSLLVTGSVILLRERQAHNAEIDFKKNVLVSARLVDKDETDATKISTLFASKVKKGYVDLETGQVTKGLAEQRTVMIALGEDIAGIRKRDRISEIYILSEGGRLDGIVFPVYGKGLWSTMYGLITIGGDLKTVKGISFYKDAETPGLGGEINNPLWQQKWIDKKIYNDEYEVDFTIAKGAITPSDPQKIYKVDGISGATLTGRGVENLVRYWFGVHGFRSFIMQLNVGGGEKR